LPFPIFLDIVLWVKDRKIRVNKFTGLPISESDASGRKCAPTELLVLGVLRVLGRGMWFDGVSELCGTSSEVIRTFFHTFAQSIAETNFTLSVVRADIERVMEVYAQLGLAGCCGSTDCVHIHWDRCPAQQRNNHVGKEGFPTLSYSVTCTHSRRITAATCGFPGAINDKTISKYDTFLQGFCENTVYSDVSYSLENCENPDVERVVHPWLLCDGGYYKWRHVKGYLVYCNNWLF
jgi:hypothetical protein